MITKVKKVVNEKTAEKAAENKKKKKKKGPTHVRKTMSTKKNVPSEVLSDYPIIIHGEYGVGKTSLFGQFPNVYFNMFEPNESYDFYFDVPESFEDFIDYKDEFLKGKHDHKAFSIDNPGPLYDYAMDYACNSMGIEHPGGQNDYGASWSKVKKTFIPPIRELMNSKKYGLLISCHTDEKDITTLSGKKYSKLAPLMNKQAYEFLCAQFPNIFYYFFIGEKRWLQIVADEHIVAKNKFKGHFITTKGDPVFRIPMGESEEEAYSNLMRAFNNKQKNSYKTAFKQKKTKFKKKSTK